MVTEKTARIPLSRDRVFSAAVDLADESGLEAVTMRGLAERLGVEAMSLYHHVTNKEALLDGVAELVVEEINAAVSVVPEATGPDDWKQVMRARILVARSIMLRHKWAPVLLETRTRMGRAVVIYYNGILEVFRAGGTSWDLAHHALHALGSRAMGYTQETFDPAPGSEEEAEMMVEFERIAPEVPLLVEMLSEVVHDDDPDTNLGWCDDQTEFEFALDILLDGLERHAETERTG